MMAVIVVMVAVLFLPCSKQKPVEPTGVLMEESEQLDVPPEVASPVERMPAVQSAAPLEPAETKISPVKNPVEPQSVSPSNLLEMLPAWMHDEQADFFREEVEIDGVTISRGRGRINWEDGGVFELEITDVGPDANASLFKSLGFNYDHGADEEAGGSFDAAGLLMNHEFDEESGEGTLQVILDDRFLVELQLSGAESTDFADILMDDTLLEKIRASAAGHD